MLPHAERDLVCGFVLNKFRGDATLLLPAPQQLASLTGVETLGVIPWLEHGLPDEDGAADPSSGSGFRVAVVRYPTASNLDEFKPLEQVAHLRWASRLDDLDADLVVLPGSKHVASDLDWLRRRGLDRGVLTRAAAGLPVLGICGGMQMLGTSMVDAGGVDGDAEGLRLLPLETTFRATKRAGAVETRFAALPMPWSSLTGQTVSGWDFVEDDAVTQDLNGHGTLVATEIAALAPREKGIADAEARVHIEPRHG